MAIVDSGASRSICKDPRQCVLFFRLPAGTLPPCQGAGGECYEAIGIGLRFKLIQMTDGSNMLFSFWSKVVPKIPFELISCEDLGTANIKVTLAPTKAAGMVMTLEQAAKASCGSVCRKVSNLHVLREDPLDLAAVRRQVVPELESLRRQGAQHFGVKSAQLRQEHPSGTGDVVSPESAHISIDGALLGTDNVRGGGASATTTTTEPSVRTRLPLRHLKAIFAYPGARTVREIANMVDSDVDHSSDIHRSTVNEQANAKAKIYRPLGKLTRDDFTPGSDQVLDWLGNKHRRDHNGNTLVLGHQDVHTRLLSYTFHKSKKASDSWRGFTQHVRNHGLPIDTNGAHLSQSCKVRVDGDTSFAGDFAEQLDKKGVAKWIGSAYVHDTNLLHIIEHSHQHVQFKTRVALAQVSTLWRDHGFDVHRYYTNCISHNAEVINYQPCAWHGGRPAIESKPGRGGKRVTRLELQRKFPVPWGALCWIIYPEEKRTAMRHPQPLNVNGVKQWVDRADKCFFLGNTIDNRYVLLNIRTGKIVYSQNCKFTNEGVDFGYADVRNKPADDFDGTDWMATRTPASPRTEDWKLVWEPGDDDDDDDAGVHDGWAAAPPPATPPSTPPTLSSTTSTTPPSTSSSASSTPDTSPLTGKRRSVRDHASTRAYDVADAGLVFSTTNDGGEDIFEGVPYNAELGDNGAVIPDGFVFAAITEGVNFYYDDGTPCPDPDEPATLDQALKGPMSQAWKASFEKELDGVKDRLTRVPLRQWLRDHPGTRPLYSTVVIKVKRDVNGKVDVLKSRLCAIGTRAEKGVAWHEKACATPRKGTLNMLECIGIERGWKIASTDITQCFLQGDFLDGQAGLQILRLPTKLREFDPVTGEEWAYQVDAPIYGLLDAANQFTRTQQIFLESEDCPLPLRRSNFDLAMYSLYIPNDPTLRRSALARLAKFNITARDVQDGKHVYHILSHIDDNRIYYTCDAAHQAFMRAFKKRFKTKPGGEQDLRHQQPELYLANKYAYSDGRVDISNVNMAARILKNCGIDSGSKTQPAPMKAKVTLPEPRAQTSGEKQSLLDYIRNHKELWISDDTVYEDVCTKYRSTLMAISYLAQSLHSELQLSVSILAQYQNFVTIEAWAALKHLLRHLDHIKNEAVTFIKTGASNVVLSAECDASLGNDLPWSGGARYGVLMRINGQAAFEVESRKSKAVCISTMGAELYGMSSAARTIEFYRRFLADIHYPQDGPTELKCDNRSAIITCETKTNQQKSRHLALRFLYVQECVQHKTIKLIPTKTDELCADILTKPKEGESFLKDKFKLKQGLHLAHAPKY